MDSTGGGMGRSISQSGSLHRHPHTTHQQKQQNCNFETEQSEQPPYQSSTTAVPSQYHRNTNTHRPTHLD